VTTRVIQPNSFRQITFLITYRHMWQNLQARQLNTNNNCHTLMLNCCWCPHYKTQEFPTTQSCETWWCYLHLYYNTPPLLTAMIKTAGKHFLKSSSVFSYHNLDDGDKCSLWHTGGF
jgi:hypothetical protein